MTVIIGIFWIEELKVQMHFWKEIRIMGLYKKNLAKKKHLDLLYCLHIASYMYEFVTSIIRYWNENFELGYWKICIQKFVVMVVLPSGRISQPFINA